MRRRGASFRLVAALTLAAFAASCASTRLPPISATGSAFRPERDEKRLWADARAEERKLREKARVYDDPALADYLDGLVRRLNPPGMADNPEVSFRVTVLADPTLNAFAYPHGALFVHTGLLARLENEDQLATVLGHEMTHVENRHMLRHERSTRNKQLVFAGAAIFAAVVLANEEGRAWESGHYGRAASISVLAQLMVGLGLQLAFVAAVNGYGRDLERDADYGGLLKMREAGYDTAQAPRVYELLKEDHGDSSRAEAFFFGSHPRLAERISTAQAWNREHPGAAAPAPADAHSSFARRMRPVVRDDAKLNIEMGRLALADDELKRVLALAPEDPQAQLLLGTLRLKQAEGTKDAEARTALERDAVGAFEEALRLDPGSAEAHRQLGLFAFMHNQRPRACVHLERFVALAPKADEAAKVRDYLIELRKDGDCAGGASPAPATVNP